MKVLVIGNSHAACLIEAWRNFQPDTPAIEMAFFARGGAAALDGFGCDGARIYASTEAAVAFQSRLGQQSEFAISDYDAIVVVGHELSSFRLVHILNKNHILGWPYPNRLDMPMITEACLKDALTDSLQAANATRILQTVLPAISTQRQKLIALPQPYPSQIILQGAAQSVGFVRVCRAGIGAQCRTLFEAVAAAQMAEIGAVFIPQPAETVAEELLTATGYTEGAKRLYNLSQRQPQTDELHANAAYGALLFQQIMQEIA